MNEQQIKLINLGLLWNKFDRLASNSLDSNNKGLAKIYFSRRDKILNEYMILYMDLNGWLLECKYIEMLANRDVPDEEIEEMIQSQNFHDWCYQQCLDSI